MVILFPRKMAEVGLSGNPKVFCWTTTTSPNSLGGAENAVRLSSTMLRCQMLQLKMQLSWLLTQAMSCLQPQLPTSTFFAQQPKTWLWHDWSPTAPYEMPISFFPEHRRRSRFLGPGPTVWPLGPTYPWPHVPSSNHVLSMFASCS